MTSPDDPSSKPPHPTVSPPVLDYQAPERPASNAFVAKFILGAILGPISAALFTAIGAGLGVNGAGVLIAFLFQIGISILFITSKPSRPFGIGLILGYPLAILILYSICALKL